MVGAGVAGSTAALVAARDDRDVLLIDRPAGRRREHGETLPAEAGQVLRELGRWPAFAALRSRACWANRSVWGSGRLHTWEQLGNPYGSGWHVERYRVEAMLRGAALGAGARLVVGSVCRVQRQDRVVRLVLDDGTEIDAPFVVDATGRPALVARLLGARRVRHDRLVGMAWQHEGDADPSTLVEAVPDGWWFSAPTATGVIAIFFGDADLVDWRSAARRYSELLDRAPHTRARVATAGHPASPTLVSASTSILRPVVGSGWIAVGDAAATYDPLASQGILHGLVTGQEAAAVGTRDSMATYEQREMVRFDEHLRHRRAQYQIERRWPTARFWRRRSESSEDTPVEPHSQPGRVTVGAGR